MSINSTSHSVISITSDMVKDSVVSLTSDMLIEEVAAAAHAPVEAAREHDVAIPAGVLPERTATVAENQTRLASMVTNAREQARDIASAKVQTPSSEQLKAMLPKPSFFALVFSSSARAANSARNELLAAIDIAQNQKEMFDKIPLKNLADKSQGSLGIKQLTSFAEKQYAVINSIEKYADAVGVLPPQLAQISMSAQFRITEAMSSVASAKASDTGTIGNAMGNVSDSMHLNSSHIEALAQKADALFADLDRLEQSKNTMNPLEFSEQTNKLRADIDLVKAEVTARLNPENGLVAEKEHFQPLSDKLDRGLERVGTLQNADARKNVLALAKAVLPSIDAGVISQITLRAEDTPLSDESRDILQRATESYNKNVETILQKIANAPANPSTAFLQEMEDALKTASYPFYNEDVFHIMKHEAEIASPGYKLICGVAFGNSSVAQAEKSLVMDMLARSSDGGHLRGDFMQKALSHNVSIDAMVEAGLRRLPVDSFNFDASDSFLEDSKTLGAGAANEVVRCVYGGVDVQGGEYVFKSEVAALRGYNRLCVAGLGHDNHHSVAALNVATTQVAKMLGCANVVAASSMGVHNGGFGLFMELAPGETCKKIDREGLLLPDGNRVKLGGLKSVMGAAVFQTMRANLMQQLNRLEWADILTGQADRHADNYLIDINTETGAVKVTGIDNDASFGEAKIGMDRIDLSRLSEAIKKSDAYKELTKMLDEIAKKSTGADGDDSKVASTPITMVDITKFTDKSQFDTLKKLFGLNQIQRPHQIDQATYDHLMGINEGEYRAELAKHLSPTALDSAMLRLEDAKRHATQLAANKGIITDWSAVSANKMPDGLIHGLQLGFAQRDFYEIVG